MISKTQLQRLALYLYFFSFNFEVLRVFGLGSVSRLAGIIYILSVVFDHRPFLKVSKVKNYFIIWSVFWIYLSFISLININQYSSEVFDLTLLFNIIFFILLINHERKDPGVLVKGLIAFALGGVFLTALYYAGFGVEYTLGRVSIFGDNQNAVGVRLCIAIIVLVYFSISNILTDKYWRWALFIPVPFLSKFMLETGSRAAVIGLVLAFILAALLLKTKHFLYKLVFIAISGLGFSYFVGMILRTEALSARLNQTFEEKDLAGRGDIWEGVMFYIKDNIIFGGGNTGYSRFSNTYFREYVSVHNVFIEILALTGLLGLSLYFVFLLKIFREAYISYKYNRFLLPLLLLIPVFGTILAGHTLKVKIAWCIFSLVASGALYRNQPSALSPKYYKHQ